MGSSFDFIRIVLIAVILSNVSFLFGESRARYGESNSFDSQWLKFKNKVISDFNKQRAANQEDLKILEQHRRRSQNEIQALAEAVQDLTIKITELNTNIAQLKQENSALKRQLNTDARKFRDAIAEEEKSRRKADQDIVKEISTELSRSPTRFLHQSGIKDKAVVNTNDHHLYEVVKGDTLGAIARAFGIPLKRFENR